MGSLFPHGTLGNVWGQSKELKGRGNSHLRRRLSWTMQSTLSQRQFPHGYCSTTSQRTLRALQEAQARAARRLVTLLFPPASDFESARLFDGESFEDLADKGASGTSFASAFVSAGCRPGVDADPDLEWVSVSLFTMCTIVIKWPPNRSPEPVNSKSKRH